MKRRSVPRHTHRQPSHEASAGPETALAGSEEDHSPGPWRSRARRVVRRLADKVLAVRMWALAAGHAVVFAFVYWLAFVLRLDFPFPSASSDTFWASLPWIVGVKVGIFYLCGHYRGWWRYVTFADLVALLRASGLSMLAVMTIGYVVFPGRIPRSIPIIDLGLTILFLGSLRASWRVFREHFWPSLRPKDYRWALVVGTDEATGVLAHQIQSSLGLPYRVRGFLHTDGKTGPAQLGRIPVLGHVDNVGRIAAACGASDILITADILPGQQIRRLMETCRQSGLTLKIIPPLKNRLDGSNRIPIRDIEINDLLRRDPVELDTQAIAQLLAGRRVLVTGAGGSIGSEICRQVLQYAPQSLLLLGRGENRIFNIERELRPSPLSRLGRGAGGEGNGDGRLTQIYSRIADITDEPRMRQIFAEFRPEIVFHAAAHKHVPLMEDNPGEAVKNNVLGTKCVADLAHEYEAENFVLISTDKAVRPTSVMGATKHLAERYVLALSEESETRFVVTRFGNVLGSAGSVVPIFQDQIQRGGPITVTDPEMTRFFMTIPEASQLVLQAAAMGKGGEIFVLEMGEPVKIVNLARDLIRLSGLSEHSIEIVYTGIRPGEKLYEELYFEDEKTLPTSHHKLRVAYHRPYTIEDVRSEVTELIGLADRPDVCICSILRRFVPEYTPCCGDCHQCPKYQEPHPASPIRKVIKPGRFSITP